MKKERRKKPKEEEKNRFGKVLEHFEYQKQEFGLGCWPELFR